MVPSEIKMKSYRGYHRDVFEGWKKLNEATIDGEGYTVSFFRLSESTIDEMCDALNGWFNIWTKFRCEYKDEQGTLSITVRKPEDADKLFNIMVSVEPIEFEHEDRLSAVDVARSKMESLINMIKDQKTKEMIRHDA